MYVRRKKPEQTGAFFDPAWIEAAILPLRHRTREAWLQAAVRAMRPWFAKEDETVPEVHVSIGFPGGRGSAKALGQCWMPSVVADGRPMVFIHPGQGDPVEVLETLAHELIHAAGHYHHRAPFQRVAHRFDFTNGGKVKTSRAESPALYARLDDLATRLGQYPGAALSTAGGPLGTGRKVQSTRMLKLECSDDGYIVRTTAKWIDSMGLPSCPCGNTLEPA